MSHNAHTTRHPHAIYDAYSMPLELFGRLSTSTFQRGAADRDLSRAIPKDLAARAALSLCRRLAPTKDSQAVGWSLPHWPLVGEMAMELILPK